MPSPRSWLTLHITPDLDEKLTDFQQQTGLSRSALVRLILTRVNRDVLAVLLMDRDPHAGAQRLLKSLKNGHSSRASGQYHDRM